MKANKHYARQLGRRLRFERLEQRRVLAVTLDLSSNLAPAPLVDAGGVPTYVNVSGQALGTPISSTTFQSEMTVDVNPVNPLNLAGFSHRNTAGGDSPTIDVFWSMDGGKDWNTTNINDLNDTFGPADHRFDPSIAFDADGNLYIAYGHRSAPISDTFNLIVAKSTNGGASFTQFRSAATASGGGVLDKWHLAIGPDGPNSDNQAVYVAYTELVPGSNLFNIMVKGSNDGGMSFTAPLVPVSSGSALRFSADPAVGPMGELYVSWYDVFNKRIYIDRDLDGLFGGTYSFGTDVPVKQTQVTLHQTPVAAAPDRGIHAGPVLDVDRSGGADHGRLYLTWVDAVDAATFGSTHNSDVYLAWSDNHGATWTLPGSIGNVEDSTGTDFLPWLDVDQTTGSVNVLYYTTDGDQATENDDVHVRLATSVDGGQSFTYARMSRDTSKEAGGFSRDYLEYIGLAVHGGTAHALWASRLPGGGTDLEALFASASYHSVSGDNVLRITGDDDGIVTHDTIVLARSALNADYLEVKVNGVLQFAGLLATVNVIDIETRAGNDTVQIDADIAAAFAIRAGLGVDGVTLRGKGASALGTFEFLGEAGNDTLTIDFQNGDPLPLAGFNFNFIGGDGTDNASVIEVGNPQSPRTAYFVDTFTDAADILVGNGRADSNAAIADDQITLRAAIQEANAATNPTYVFLPNGTNALSLTGTGGDAQGDLEISKNVRIIGTGAGLSVIDAGAMSGEARIFDVASGATLNVSRVTLTLGDTPNGQDGGGIRVQNGGILNLEYSAIVGNETGSSGDGGGIFFAATGSGSIRNSVITVNEADDTAGGVRLASAAAGTGGTVIVCNTIIAKNTDGGGSTPDVYAGANRTFTSEGNNRLGNATTGFTNGVNGDYVGTPNYIVTTLADTYDGSSDPVGMSVRDAIHQANITAGAQEIWLPAWKFVLTRQRTTPMGQEEIDVSQGDLEIKGSLTIRGVNNATSVAWRVGLANDKIFELMGDYNTDDNGDGIPDQPAGVTTADQVIWNDTQGSTTDLRADGNDDGTVNQADRDIWALYFGNTLSLLGVSVTV